MPWFKVDDAFHSHPKVLAAGNAAMGLWTRCGSYASNYSTDGFIPDVIARAYGTRQEAARLVDAGWWHPVDGGYQLHDFLEYNPTAEQVKHDRAAAAERQQRARASRRDSRRDSRRESHDPVPSRPDPSRPIDVRTQQSSSSEHTPTPATDDDDRFARTLELIVDAKVRDRQGIRNVRAYRVRVRTEAAEQHGELIRRMVDDGTAPEVVALFVLGHAEEPPKPKVPWCDSTCSTCDGTAWIDTGDGLAACPDRKAPA